ncbi:MAG: response regulator transcription factor [Candidatus Electryonea clarkiae]|nr:response regulator transcription factor [Candidatus Electryonea clarkiae]MDP8287765.1 response regulator transcription factor [Candidatus Electryonea clarkiae]
MSHILIIEDDPRLGLRLKRNLELSGYRVTLARDGLEGWQRVREGSANLVLLDLMLPHLDGTTLLNRMRKERFMLPVIILTAKGQEAERIDGFRAGCDDYVTKPFSLLELIERVRAVLRRSGYREETPLLQIGDWRIDPEAHEVRFRELPVHLSPLEFDLLYLLMQHADHALSRHFLLNEIWGISAEVTDRTVDTHIAYLRRKFQELGEDPGRIVTVYKVGYKWKVI